MYEFIVPLIFVAIWVVTWVLNREAQPLPPRQGKRLPPYDEPGDQTNWAGPINDSTGVFRQESSTITPNAKSFSRPVRPEASLDPREPILYTEPVKERAPESNGANSPTRPARGHQSRKGGRSKGALGARAKHRPAPEQTRELTQKVFNSLSQIKGRGIELKPLNLPLSPLTSIPLTQSGGLPRDLPSRIADNSRLSLRSESLQTKLKDPAKLREILVWHELMQPPLALRHRPFRNY